MRPGGMHRPSTRLVPCGGGICPTQRARPSMRVKLLANSPSGPASSPDRDPSQSPRQPEIRMPRLASAELRARLLRNRERASRAGVPSQPPTRPAAPRQTVLHSLLKAALQAASFLDVGHVKIECSAAAGSAPAMRVQRDSLWPTARCLCCGRGSRSASSQHP
jgi:hypothetical protein